ncbi:hypothetical protein HYPSUDRAFT_1017856 [Hypholoma sublateritium FD-334 SS-4]|uniref:Uncharacterized protein n=1 Tax=Hypholoma sublateritium (strain FD-334 SS-4) TaxID=945553 RepID=A0A0D2M2P7_HYPSF|nr:hypothetical protein HYPSUDRAFT_1017856 [Hypholoma sublateritium FD-334 SS-4]
MGSTRTARTHCWIPLVAIAIAIPRRAYLCNRRFRTRHGGVRLAPGRAEKKRGRRRRYAGAAVCRYLDIYTANASDARGVRRVCGTRRVGVCVYDTPTASAGSRMCDGAY